MNDSRITIGVDEAGRGCLAGPVMAAAVILPEVRPKWVDGIKDSKKLSPKKRVELANKIVSSCFWSIREASPHQIDEINILRATLKAMREAVEDVFAKSRALPRPGLVLIDGNHALPDLSLPVEQKAIKDGDNLVKVIGAASILAKVYRDNYMTGMDQLYPEYGFAKHKGYGTAQHREAIMVHGPCPMHRKTFRGVFEYVPSEETF